MRFQSPSILIEEKLHGVDTVDTSVTRRVPVSLRSFDTNDFFFSIYFSCTDIYHEDTFGDNVFVLLL